MDEIEFYATHVIKPLLEQRELLKKKKYKNKDEKELLLKYDIKISESYKKLEQMIDEKITFSKDKLSDIL